MKSFVTRIHININVFQFAGVILFLVTKVGTTFQKVEMSIECLDQPFLKVKKLKYFLTIHLLYIYPQTAFLLRTYLFIMFSLLSKITNGFINKQFDIVKYINSLPSDTTEINVSALRLTFLPDLTRFKHLTHLYCRNNQLTWLPPLPSSLEYLDVSYNKLTKLSPFNSKLTRLDCEHNLLTNLPYLNNIAVLICSNNPMPRLPALNTKLIFIKCDLLCCSTLYSNKRDILMNFRFTFYCLKLKNKFKKWLWEKVREPKVMAKFHPHHLNELKDTDDLEVFLDNWIK